MEIITQIVKTLGSFRAENLGEQLFQLYIKPAYFPKLLTPIPCILQGGRGTGKTTVLKSLSYEGQFNLAGNNIKAFEKLDYIGIYYKLETGLVSSFSGAGKEKEFWQNAFSHFINLQLCKLLCDFCIWYQAKRDGGFEFDKYALGLLCRSLKIPELSDLKAIRYNLDSAIADLESDVNFAADSSIIRSTPIGSLPRRFVNLMRNVPGLNNKTIYFVLDEYENLHDYQQEILNTFIKQADSGLSFKIGVRELGLKTKRTLNSHEQLVDPADYVLIDISKHLTDSEFDSFAQSVFEHRFTELKDNGLELPISIPELLEDLSEEEEAKKLGVEEFALSAINEIKEKATQTEASFLTNFSLKDFSLMRFLSEGQKDLSVYDIYKDSISNQSAWKNKVNNYSYSMLFSIRKKKVGITKYYCGWKTFLSLSGGNIRYLLQLVTNSLIDHAKEGKPFSKQISAECQTEVAREIGRKNLLELEGLSTRGAQLMKLVLGLGQIFHEMAIQPEGHAPEITQFEVQVKFSTGEEIKTQIDELLRAAVMHLALTRNAGTKLSGAGDTRDFDYMLHPIFSPFFVYSHRKKRKFTLNAEDLLGIVTSPTNTIKSILSRQNRVFSSEIPEQLQLFGGFYEGNS